MKDPKDPRELKDLKVMIVAIAAALLASMGLIAALDSYVARIHTQAAREVVRLETVVIAAPAAPAWSRAARMETATTAGQL